MRINGNSNGRAQESLTEQVASFAELGSAEAAIAMASAAIEEQQDRSRQLRSQARIARREVQHEQLDEMKEAAAFRFAAGVASGATQAAAGFTGMAGGSEAAVGAVKGGGDIVSAGLNAGAEAHNIAVERAKMQAEELEEVVASFSEDVDRAGRMMDKALGHADQIADARHQARTAAIRG